MNDALDLFIDYLRVERHLSENTLGAYFRDLRKLIQFLSKKEGIDDLSQVRHLHLAHFLRSLAEAGLAASSQARALSAVHQ
ncbi:site-specific integrase, partial [Myxococcota bacterium]|nr:site-specific integrase [Myxococcota bacterium]